MDFGKLKDIHQVDFGLPFDNAASVDSLRRAYRPDLSAPRVHVGCPIWTAKSWVGKLYPPKTPTTEFLKIYSRQFNTIELNTTHYRIPDLKTVDRWRDTAPEGFKFCPKFPQGISHEHQLKNVDDLSRAFCESISKLGEKLGPCFLQLPPSFAPAQLGDLERFLKKLPCDLRIAVEFRHERWFHSHQILKDAVALLEAFNALTVITDVAGRRDVLHTSLPAPVAFIRFVGNSATAIETTDHARLDEWVERLFKWSELGMQEIYFFVHEPEDTFAPDLAQYFIRKLNARFGRQLVSEPHLNETKPFARESPQISLF